MKAEFEITGKCVFGEIDYVKVVKLIPPDVMHDFMECVVPTVESAVSLLNIMPSVQKIAVSALNNAIQKPSTVPVKCCFIVYTLVC